MITRNTEVVAESGTYRIHNITLTATTQKNHLASAYTSTLEVTGYLPGVYEYTVSNRAMTSAVTGNYEVDGNAPSKQ